MEDKFKYEEEVRHYLNEIGNKEKVNDLNKSNLIKELKGIPKEKLVAPPIVIEEKVVKKSFLDRLLSIF